jgi:hypothetical protein
MDALIQLISGSALQDGALYLLRNVPGFPPIIQTVHILGIAAVMASVVMIDLRVLGLALPSQNIAEMTRRLMPWLWIALASNLVSGGVFVLARPARYFNNPVFGWKFTFMLPAILLTLLFHLLGRYQENYWSLSRQRIISAKVLALLSLLLWIMVAMAGRWIAYAEYIYMPADPL